MPDFTGKVSEHRIKQSRLVVTISATKTGRSLLNILTPARNSSGDYSGVKRIFAAVLGHPYKPNCFLCTQIVSNSNYLYWCAKLRERAINLCLKAEYKHCLSNKIMRSSGFFPHNLACIEKKHTSENSVFSAVSVSTPNGTKQLKPLFWIKIWGTIPMTSPVIL